MKERRKRVSKVLQGICKEENLGRYILFGPVFLFVLINFGMFLLELASGEAIHFYGQNQGYGISVIATMFAYTFGRNMPKKMSDKSRTMKKGLVDSRELLGILPIAKKEVVLENVRWWQIVNLAVFLQIAIVQVEGIVFGMEMAQPLNHIFFPLVVIVVQSLNLLGTVNPSMVVYWISVIVNVLFYICCFFPVIIIAESHETPTYYLSMEHIQVGNVVPAVAILLLGIGYLVVLTYCCKRIENRKFAWME